MVAETRRAGRIAFMAAFVAAFATGRLAAQMPGAPTVDTDLEAAKFRAWVLEQVRPVVEAWEDAWRGQDSATVGSFYMPDAVLVLPGTLIGGRDEIGRFAEAARPTTPGLIASILDFEPSDRMAYLFGSWTAQSTGGGDATTGRLVTMLRKVDDAWEIRTQMFAIDGANDPFPRVQRPPSLPGIAERIVPDPGTSRTQRQRVSDLRSRAYRDLVGAVAAFRRAWRDDNASAAMSLIRDDAMLRLPGETLPARASQDALEAAFAETGALNTVELDFEVSGTLGFLTGRYYVESNSGYPRAGTYIAVFRNQGSGWRIRSLVFS